MKWENLNFVPYFEGPDRFVEKYKGLSAQLMVDLETGHMRFSPMPNSELLDDFYSNSFSRSELNPTPESEFNQEVISIASGVINHIKSIDPKETMPKQWRVFDIGCGFGGFVWAMQQNGMKAWGNELNPTWVQQGNLYCNDNLYYGQFADVQPLIKERYDFIFISHTLEHLPEPAELLREAKKHLAPSGLIYVNVPNSRSNRFREKGRRSGIDYGNFPMHVNFFTPSSLRHIAQRNGFKVIQLRTRPLDELHPILHADDVKRFDELYLGGELFALLAHESNNLITVDEQIDEKIKGSSKNVSFMYMQSKVSLFNKIRIALNRSLSKF